MTVRHPQQSRKETGSVSAYEEQLWIHSLAGPSHLLGCCHIEGQRAIGSLYVAVAATSG